jgi:hypothetical protein
VGKHGHARTNAVCLTKKRKASEQEVNQLAKKACGSGYQCQVAASDDDFWFVHPFLNMLILI